MIVSQAPALLLADTSVVRHFCEAGAGPQLRDYTQDRIFVTLEVSREIRRNRALKTTIQSFCGADKWPPLLAFDEAVERLVGQALTARNGSGFTHPDEDAGEISTVFYADSLRDEVDYLLLMDDGYGKDLAAGKSLPVLDTPHLAVEMACADLIIDELGARIWQNSCQGTRDAFFDALATQRANVA